MLLQSAELSDPFRTYETLFHFVKDTSPERVASGHIASARPAELQEMEGKCEPGSLTETYLASSRQNVL